jgi:hypothetical protein
VALGESGPGQSIRRPAFRRGKKVLFQCDVDKKCCFSVEDGTREAFVCWYRKYKWYIFDCLLGRRLAGGGGQVVV